MGTNYYLIMSKCASCGETKKLHIGKSSAGWCFALHVIPELGLNTLDQWKALFSDTNIENEYAIPIPVEEMLDIITNRCWPWPKNNFGGEIEEEFHKVNGSMRGPNGLMRSRIGFGCVAHGEGTWDCIAGEFT